MISQPRTFVLDRFLLTVNKECLLVEVKECSGNESSMTVRDLPAWIFYSEHTLWLTNEDKPLRDRALEGEKIRASLAREFALAAAD